MASFLAALLGGLLDWLFPFLVALFAGVSCGGCSLSAAWAAPHQAQTSGENADVSQPNNANAPQQAGPTSRPTASPLPLW